MEHEEQRGIMTCPDCLGNGAKYDSEIELWILCGTCDGDGYVWMIEIDEKPLIVGWHPKPVEGNTVSLYCDECGELYCEHRPEKGNE